MESELDRICRKARERDAEMIANPSNYSSEEVAQAKLRQYQEEGLSVASILRYGD